MTIQEAIKSGKPFRRPHWVPNFYETIESIEDKNFLVYDLLATDWQIKKEPRVFYVNEYPDGKTGELLHKTEDSARDSQYMEGAKVIKLVEVIE